VPSGFWALALDITSAIKNPNHGTVLNIDIKGKSHSWAVKIPQVG
jgi:hypothetical protein